MATQAVTSINCPNCRTPFTAPIQQIFDVQADPEAKSRLLSGQLNVVLCPHCGFQGALNAPFLYHDADLELAFVYVPLDLGITDIEQQKTIGDLTNRLMQGLPPEARKGYLLQPRTFFSIQSLVDAMLELDEETRELVEQQQRKMALFEQLRQIDPGDSLALAEFIGANDEELDEMFFQLLDVLTSIVERQGDTAEHTRLEQLQAKLLEKSSMGQVIKAQQAAVSALAENPHRETLIEQLVAAETTAVRAALIAVGRQLLDYAFFQSLTARIDAAIDSATKEKLVALRKEILEIRDQIDDVTMAALEARSVLLRELTMADDPRELVLRRIAEIDNAFFNVLNVNMQQAEVSGRQDVVDRLRLIGNLVMEVLNEAVPPEVRLVGRLMSAENNEQVNQLLEEERGLLNQDLMVFLERTLEDLPQEGRHEEVERLRYAAEQIRGMISA